MLEIRTDREIMKYLNDKGCKKSKREKKITPVNNQMDYDIVYKNTGAHSLNGKMN